jgi:hypothetical protein
MARSGRNYRKRLASIVDSHRILFESPFAGMDAEGPSDYDGLLRFRQKPGRGKIRRLQSIVRAHSALFAEGLAEADPSWSRNSRICWPTFPASCGTRETA